MPEYSEMIRITDQEALAMIRTLADQDLRSMGSQVAWLIRQEWARRHSQPNPLVTVEEAIEAGEQISE